MAELKNDEEEHALPAKRKPDAELESKHAGGDESTLKKQKSEEDENNSSKKLIDQVQDEENDEEEEEDYEHEDSDDDEEESEDEGERPSREAEFHHKGKGILKEDPKGKGKLVEEANDSSDDDDDDDDDSDSDDGDDSDLSDDPLAEVDLDNILPSRTRRCGGARPGLAIAKDDNDA